MGIVLLGICSILNTLLILIVAKTVRRQADLLDMASTVMEKQSVLIMGLVDERIKNGVERRNETQLSETH